MDTALTFYHIAGASIDPGQPLTLYDKLDCFPTLGDFENNIVLENSYIVTLDTKSPEFLVSVYFDIVLLSVK